MSVAIVIYEITQFSKGKNEYIFTLLSIELLGSISEITVL